MLFSERNTIQLVLWGNAWTDPVPRSFRTVELLCLFVLCCVTVQIRVSRGQRSTLCPVEQPRFTAANNFGHFGSSGAVASFALLTQSEFYIILGNTGHTGSLCHISHLLASLPELHLAGRFCLGSIRPAARYPGSLRHEEQLPALHQPWRQQTQEDGGGG